MPSGTEVYAPVAGKVLDAVTGVPNVPGGSGSPSNWVTFGFMDKDGRKVSLYFQHLKDARTGLVGQWVQPGTLLGHSGNSGNSSGPHLHLTFQTGWRYEWDRYAYLDGSGAIYPPSKAWDTSWKGQPTMPLSDEDARKVAKAVWALKVDTKDASGKPLKKPASWLLQNGWMRVADNLPLKRG
jgi:murein DD-endopeptidase MepM/ murein hydrolase activator NlpD